MSKWYSNKKGFSIERLAALASVAEHGGIMNAAGGDATRQSQLSRQMKELEGFFDFALLDRSSTPHQVTDAGRQIARHTELFLQSMKSSVDHFANERPCVSLAAGESIIQWFLIPMLAKKLTQKNSPRVRFLNQTSSQTVDRLINGIVDIGIIKESSKRGSLAFKEISSYHSDVLYHPAHFKPGKNPTWASLASMPIAIQDHSDSLRATIDRLNSDLDTCPQIIAECTSYPQVLELVMNGSCVGILPRIAGKHAENKGCKWMGLTEFEDDKATIGVAWDESRMRNFPVMQTVLKWFGVK
jgi:DNA-binding transcriptional LysR family regulator